MAEGQRSDYGIVLGKGGRAAGRAGKVIVDTATSSASETHGMIHRVARKNITFADAATTVTITLPAKSFVWRVLVEVVTAFNGDTTNTIEIGDGADANGYAATTMATLATPAVYGFLQSALGPYLQGTSGTVNDTIYYAASDTIDIPVISTATATTGECNVFVFYCCLDDLDATL